MLKSLRNQRGLTQKQLGEKLGISQRMVAFIEASPEKTRFERILQILSILDADLIIRDRNADTAKVADTIFAGLEESADKINNTVTA